ncbi:hypothetical protein FF1_028443 [Malus domestica]
MRAAASSRTTELRQRQTCSLCKLSCEPRATLLQTQKLEEGKNDAVLEPSLSLGRRQPRVSPAVEPSHRGSPSFSEK